MVSAGVPTNLGAGTNEDVALIVERSNVVLAGGDVSFRVFEEVGSGTLTVRSQAYGSAGLIVLSAAAVAKVTGLTPPTGF